LAASLARSLSDLNNGIDCPIVCEVLDPHTQKTIANSKGLSLTSDFCQTNKLVAQVLAMVSEERTVNLLFDELLGTRGCSIAVVPSSRYAYVGELVNFHMLAKRAAIYGELLFGYQVRNSIEKTVLNPRCKEQLCTWDDYDLAILKDGAKAPRSSRISVADAAVNRLASIEKKRNESGNSGLPGSEFANFAVLCRQMSGRERQVLWEALTALRGSVVRGLKQSM